MTILLKAEYTYKKHIFRRKKAHKKNDKVEEEQEDEA